MTYLYWIRIIHTFINCLNILLLICTYSYHPMATVILLIVYDFASSIFVVRISTHCIILWNRLGSLFLFSTLFDTSTLNMLSSGHNVLLCLFYLLSFHSCCTTILHIFAATIHYSLALTQLICLFAPL